MSAATVTELFAAALAGEWDSDERWEHIHELRCHPTRETFDAAVALCRSDDPQDRSVGVDVLAQLKPHLRYADAPKRWDPHAPGPFHDETVDLLLAMLDHEQEVIVLDAIGTGLGHLSDPRGIEPMSAFRDHPSAIVRHAVAFAMLCHDDDRAVTTLLGLMTDLDSDVRDWATFGIGSQIERDTPEIREALAARLMDADADTRVEAIGGLAARGDLRALEPLLEMREHFEGLTVDEALCDLARATGDPRLRDELERHVTAWRRKHRGKPLPDDLAAALARYATPPRPA